MLQDVRAGMDPYPMMGWRMREVEGGGACVYEGPNGEVYEHLREAYEQEVAARSAQPDLDENRLALTFLQKFLNECCAESEERGESGQRFVVTTRTLSPYRHPWQT